MTVRKLTLDDLGDPHAPRGSRDWCQAVKLQAARMLRDVDSAAKWAAGRLSALKAAEAWKPLGLLSWDCLMGELGITAEQADNICNARPSHRLGDVLAAAKEDGPALEHGPPRKENKHLNKMLNFTDNTSAICRKLMRDAESEKQPKERQRLAARLLREIEAGTKSIHSAALEFGYRKRRLSVPGHSVEAACLYLSKHFELREIVTAWPKPTDDTAARALNKKANQS